MQPFDGEPPPDTGQPVFGPGAQGGPGQGPGFPFGGSVPGIGDPKAEAIALLASLQESSGLNILELLSSLAPPPGPTQTRDGVQAPGTGIAPGLGLSAEDLELLATELCDLVDRYQRATEHMVEEEREIRDAYRMAAEAGSGGPSGSSNDESLISEFVMVQVDQITARLVTNITSVRPLIKVDPVLGSGYDDPKLADLAKTTEGFLCQYIPNEMDFRHLLPATVLRTVKVGTSVLRVAWEEDDREIGFYLPGDATEHTEIISSAGVRARLIENRQVIIWPPTALNWQRDYEIVGHESWHSRSSWRRLASEWGLSTEVREKVEAMPGERSADGESEHRDDRGVDTSQMEGQKLLDPQVKLTELWCHLWLPEPFGRRVKFQVILHRPTRQILWSGLNTHFTRKHPYFPVRYKLSDLSAWGTGVGHEALNCWAADTALWRLSLENIAAGAFNIVIRDAASVHSTQNRPVRPGMEVVSNNPEKDFIVRAMGGDAQDLPMTRRENEERLKKATGVPDVAMGMGDTTMKSGAGTGSTLALIEQAGMKIRYIDQTIREDLSDIFGFVLELCCQYGDDGVFYNVVGEDDAAILRRLTYTPPRGKDIASMFRIQAMAPSAATSTEARRNNMMLIWGFATQAVQAMNEFAGPLLQARNPAGLERWQFAMAATLHEIMRRVLELHEVPGILSVVPPALPETTPQDQQINDLNMQVQQAQQLIYQLQYTLEEIAPGTSEAMGLELPPELAQGQGDLSGESASEEMAPVATGVPAPSSAPAPTPLNGSHPSMM